MSDVTFVGLPAWSVGPGPGAPAAVDALRAAGVEAVQTREPQPFLEAGFRATGMARLMAPGEADEAARRGADLGLDFTTVHLGDGLESDADADRLVDDMLEAVARRGHALHLETHRGTITQD